ncbi:MAG TPA: hypothetical protein VD886_23700 [Herpetosiphonaceae bacterium]|nr:hypothetical protein [Herpetosiphonaceae bacterium]
MNQRAIVVFAVFAGCLLLQACGGGSPGPQPVTVLRPHQEVGGDSLGTWASRWWQWALAVSPERSPVRDKTGVDCHVGQSGPVWFLAGSYETDPVVRSCAIPADKYVFFPLINSIDSAESAGAVCVELAADVASQFDTVAGLYATIDGTPIPGPKAHRERSPSCFDPYKLVGGGYSGTYLSSADGFWIMLEPLPPGRHELAFGGSTDWLSQDITYNLEVK